MSSPTESNNEGTSQAVAAKPAAPKRRPARRRKVSKLPPWNVVLLDDDQHTYAYVIDMLGRIFGHPTPRAMQLAREVDSSGRVIVFTGHRELAELKRDQIRGFGADIRIASCQGSMTAVLEPAK